MKAPDGMGLMAELSKAVLGMGGEIVDFSSSFDETAGAYRLVIKGQTIDVDRVVASVQSPGYRVIQIREVRLIALMERGGRRDDKPYSGSIGWFLAG